MANLLSKELKNLIVDCVDKGIIQKDDTFELWKASNEEDLIIIFSEILRIDKNEKDKLWLHIVNTKWNNLNDIYSKNEIMLLKHLINGCGVVSRTELLKNIKSFKNNYSLNLATEELLESNIINKIQLSNSKILFVLTPQFLKDIREI